MKRSTTTQFPVTVTESDLKQIGNTTCQNHFDGNNYPSDGTCFILSNYTEYFFLRSIITSLGFKLSKGEDFYRGDDRQCDIIVYTTYPFSRYETL